MVILGISFTREISSLFTLGICVGAAHISIKRCAQYTSPLTHRLHALMELLIARPGKGNAQDNHRRRIRLENRD